MDLYGSLGVFDVMKNHFTRPTQKSIFNSRNLVQPHCSPCFEQEIGVETSED